jgi:alpha-amylase
LTVRLVLALHFHQPVGNFDHVFEKAVSLSYRPIVEHFERHPGVRAAFHLSGCLLEWLEAHDAGLVDRIVELVGRGQVEPMGGGFYEPILSVIPRDDALEQIARLTAYWKKRAGKVPSGAWLTERVWEPSMAELLCDAGIRYTLLDDQHLRFAGLLDRHFPGVYVTERAGKPVAFFPSDYELRYLIPFRTVETVRDHFSRVPGRPEAPVLTYGDDAEKFGLWPGTHPWVYGEGWLEKFFTLLEEPDGPVRSVKPEEVLAGNPQARKVYVPNSSYPEMLEWALPPASVREYARLRTELQGRAGEEAVKAFVRGSLWDMFLARYPEADQMHKRALRASRRAHALPAKAKRRAAAVTAALRAQCNCAYWHGLFGGIYLPHLRHGVYASALEAERIVAAEGPSGVTAETLDFDGDLEAETILGCRTVQAFFRPSDAATLTELDYLPARFNVANVMSRWRESYHEGSDLTHGPSASGGVASPHERAVAIRDADLAACRFDTLPIRSFREFASAARPDLGSIRDGIGLTTASGRVLGLEPTRRGFDARVRLGDGEVAKSVELSEAGLLTVRWRPGTGGSGWFGAFVAFTLLARGAPDRRALWLTASGESASAPGAEREADDVRRITLMDEAFGFALDLIPTVPARVVAVPIETLQRSEREYEAVYQGTLFALAWPEGTKACGLEVSFRALRR